MNLQLFPQWDQCSGGRRNGGRKPSSYIILFFFCMGDLMRGIHRNANNYLVEIVINFFLYLCDFFLDNERFGAYSAQ